MSHIGVRRWTRAVAILVLTTGAAAFAVSRQVPRQQPPLLLSLELARSAGEVRRLAPSAVRDAVGRAQSADGWYFIPSYWALFVATGMAIRRSGGTRNRRLGAAVIAAISAAAALDYVENAAIAAALERADATWSPTAAATGKWLLLFVAASTVAMALALAPKRRPLGVVTSALLAISGAVGLLGTLGPHQFVQPAVGVMAAGLVLMALCWTRNPTYLAGSEENEIQQRKADRAVAFPDVLERELDRVAARRSAVLGVAGAPDAKDADAVLRVQRISTFGLAFSGGGIRSATFSLGVLQALSEAHLLKYVDYLSTVSGGGYIGSWLHGVLYRGERADDPKPTEATTALPIERQRALAAAQQAEAQLRRAEGTLRSGIRRAPGPADQDPITFLRKYSNYLAPRPGLFSADTWTIGFIWLRNVLLNKLILVPAIAALVGVTLFAVLAVQQTALTYSVWLGADIFPTILALVCLVAAIVLMTRELRDITREADGSAADRAKTAAVRRTTDSRTVVGLVFATLVLVGASHFDVQAWTRSAVTLVFFVLMVAIQGAGGYVECHVRAHKKPWAAGWDVLWMSAVAGAVAGSLVTLVWDLMNGASLTREWSSYVHLAYGPPLVGASFVVSVMLLIGLMGADYPDAAREWTAKTGSILAIVTAAWIAWFTLAVFGPWLVTRAFRASSLSATAATIGWIATTVGGVLAGRSPRSGDGSSPATGKALSLLVAIAPTVFLIGYIIAIAAGVQALISPEGTPSTHAAGQTEARRPIVTISPADDNRVQLVVEPEKAGTIASWLQPIAALSDRFAATLVLAPPDPTKPPSLTPADWKQLGWALVVSVVAAIVAVIASRRINVNEFSLHHFYKNRLVRCYLGASNARRRRPNPSTGFDSSDDLPIARLRPDTTKDPYFGPYPIVNAALNLNAGSELATQERKATSFVFTPDYCGFSTKRVGEDGAEGEGAALGDGPEPNGYRRTANYAYPDGPSLGTAFAISGAAANPNWGYHTSGPMAFLLTVFNARLGWWLGNPRWREASREPGPKFALRYLFSELLGQTTAESQFVNLSDGGHFENLGLYELVQRRCRYIVVCDAEQDGGLTFGSLGGAIRKCRADFGVEIDIDPQPIRQSAPGGFSTAHCVVGTIFYPEPETAVSAGVTSGIGTADGSPSRGWLVYLKSSLTGDEPADVIEYRSQFPEFPHQSTGDQFFSESQFESYRRLGYHVCRSAFGGVDLGESVQGAIDATKQEDKAGVKALLDRYPLTAVFQEMARKWYAPIPVSGAEATRLADAYVALMQRLSKDDKVAQLYAELTTGKRADGDRPQAPTAAELTAGMDLMQLVQNVYTEFNFESGFNRANPRNSGWMSVFRKWHDSPILTNEIWPKIRNDYHALFQAFYSKRLGDPGGVAERP